MEQNLNPTTGLTGAGREGGLAGASGVFCEFPSLPPQLEGYVFRTTEEVPVLVYEKKIDVFREQAMGSSR